MLTVPLPQYTINFLAINMDKFEIVVTTLFGIEAIVAKEIRDLGYKTTEVSDGRVTFLGDFNAVSRANLFLRT